jgi:hypothetical protein
MRMRFGASQANRVGDQRARASAAAGRRPGGRLGAVVLDTSTSPTSPILVVSRPRRRRLTRAVTANLVLDGVLLVAFVASQAARLTGLVAHEVVGVALGVGLLVHVVLHWGWITGSTRRLLARRPARDALPWVNDVLLVVAMTMCVLSGVLSSRVVLPFFGIFTGRSDVWLELHLRTADLTLFFVAIHLALSWRWVLVVLRRPGAGHRRATRSSG